MKESQTSMMQHSEVKVRLLKLYLERYLSIISSVKYFGDIHVYDLFCGEGIYDNGGKGSPLIIAEEITNTFLLQRAAGKLNNQFHCYFNDIEEWKLDKVKAEVESRNLLGENIGKCYYSSIDYRDIVGRITNQISTFRNQKAFVFIDPYGYKDIKVADILSLLRTKKAEILLFLPTQFMFRFETKGTPESLKEFINELMPITSWPASNTGVEFIQNLTEAFRGVVGRGNFVDSFVISRDLNQFFCLFFFSPHIYGFDRMLDAKWRIDEEEGRGWKYNEENSLFSQFEKQPNIIRFEKQLKTFLQDWRTNSDVYQFTLSTGHLPGHATQILTRIQSEVGLAMISADGKAVKKGAFFINYKEHRDNPGRIKIKLQ